MDNGISYVCVFMNQLLVVCRFVPEAIYETIRLREEIHSFMTEFEFHIASFL